MNYCSIRVNRLSSGVSRRPKYEAKTAPRCRPENVKQAIVREREYKNIRTVSEDVAEFEYSPVACKKTYRMVVLRKNLSVERGEQRLFDDIVYFFYLTNKRDIPAEEIVWESNERCNQENLIAQLKSGVHAPARDETIPSDGVEVRTFAKYGRSSNDSAQDAWP